MIGIFLVRRASRTHVAREFEPVHAGHFRHRAGCRSEASRCGLSAAAAARPRRPWRWPPRSPARVSMRLGDLAHRERIVHDHDTSGARSCLRRRSSSLASSTLRRRRRSLAHERRRISRWTSCTGFRISTTCPLPSTVAPAMPARRARLRADGLHHHLAVARRSRRRGCAARYGSRSSAAAPARIWRGFRHGRRCRSRPAAAGASEAGTACCPSRVISPLADGFGTYAVAPCQLLHLLDHHRGHGVGHRPRAQQRLACVTARVSGRVIVKVAPRPGVETISTRPPREVISFFTTSMPTPRPAIWFTSVAVEKPGTKMNCARNAPRAAPRRAREQLALATRLPRGCARSSGLRRRPRW